jgi:hypothetical protein
LLILLNNSYDLILPVGPILKFRIGPQILPARPWCSTNHVKSPLLNHAPMQHCTPCLISGHVSLMRKHLV